jgi:Domain of unknown function (DUF6484)
MGQDMSAHRDPLEVVVIDQQADEFSTLSRKPVGSSPALPTTSGALTARFDGFDSEDRPLVSGVPGVPGQSIPARATVPLQNTDIGSTVVVLCEGGDLSRPIVVGVLQDRPPVAVHADDQKMVISAEREITLQCGDASITLTRAGKVIIQGAYIVSRSTGYNKIKGATVDIN